MARVIPVTENFTGRTVGGGEREVRGGELGHKYYVPDQATAKRIDGYEFAERMLDPDEHHDLYQEVFPDAAEPDKQYWISVDFPGMLARLMKQYTIGRDFRVVAREGTSDEVDRIVECNQLPKRLRQATESLPAVGDAVFRVDVEEDEDGRPQACIRYVRPHNYHPKFDALDGERVREVELAWVFRVGDGQQVTGLENGQPFTWSDSRTQRMVVLREVHAPAEEGEDSGTIKYYLHTWDGKELGEDELRVQDMFPDLEDHETGIKSIPIVHVGYQVRAGEHFGCSEFLRIQRIFLALENRLSQEDEVLEKHARPKLVVGPGVLDEEAKASLADFDVIEIDPDVLEKMVRPEYLTWDMQLGGIQHEIEKLEEYLFMTTETSPASFGLERDGSQVESARALKFKAHRTVNKVDDLRDEWTPAIKQLLKLAQERELAAGAEYDVAAVAVDFGEAIVEDPSQEVVDYSTLKGAHLVSRKRALRDLHRLTDREADQEEEAILQDMVDEAAAQAQSMGMAFGGAPTVPGEQPPEQTAPPEQPGTPAGEAGLGVAEGIQQTLLNGAQVQAMASTITSVAKGELPRGSGLEILQVAFGVSAQDALKLMGDAGLEPPPTPATAKPPVVPGSEGEQEQPAVHTDEEGVPTGHSAAAQSVIFSKATSPDDVNGGDGWTVRAATSWLKAHDMRSDTHRETTGTYRFRQFPPEECDGDYVMLRENLPAGVSIVACERGGN